MNKGLFILFSCLFIRFLILLSIISYNDILYIDIYLYKYKDIFIALCLLIQLLIFVIDFVLIIINLIDNSSYEYILLDLNYIIKYPDIFYYFIISLSNDINYINKNNFSLLSFMIVNKFNINIIKYLLKKGTKVSTYDITMLNSIKDNLLYNEIYKELIYHGYDINTKLECKFGGYTNLMLILSRYNKYYKNKLEHLNDLNNLNDLIYFILNNTNINLNITDSDGYNCLMYISDINLYNYLVKRGANYNIKNKYNQNILIGYIINNNYKMAKEVSKLFDTHEKDLYNKSPIQYALEKINYTYKYNIMLNIINIFNGKDKEYIVKNISYRLLNSNDDHIIKII
jgi:hypothetical protein